MNNETIDDDSKIPDMERKPYEPPKVMSVQKLEAVASDCGKTDLIACSNTPPVLS